MKSSYGDKESIVWKGCSFLKTCLTNRFPKIQIKINIGFWGGGGWFIRTDPKFESAFFCNVFANGGHWTWGECQWGGVISVHGGLKGSDLFFIT